jgi:hypothetical protein
VKSLQKRQLSKGVTLEQFECGYYDVGALAQSSVPLQAGCMAKHVVRNSGLLQALISFVPATEALTPNAPWPETLLVTK